jgi:anti-sigma B factor antagonist
MKVRIRTNRLIYILDIQGVIEFPDANLLKELVMKMVQKKVERLIINVKDIRSIDSSGIGALIFIYSTMKKMNLPFAIANVGGSVKAVMDKINISGYFPLYNNLNDAIRELSGNRP